VNSSLFPINEEEVLSFGVARDITQLIQQQKFIEEQKEVLQSLSDISNQLISSFGTNLDRIADWLAHHIETSHFLLYLEPFDDQEYLLRARGIKAPDIEQHIHQIYKSYSVKKRMEIELLPEDLTGKILHERGLQLFFVPVLNENKFWGFFIFSKGIDYQLTKEKVQFLQQLASLLSLYLIQYESHIALENQFNTFSQILNAVDAVVIVTDTETGEIYFHNNKFNLLLDSHQYSDQKKIAKFLKEIIQNNLDEFYLKETDKWYKIYSSKISWFRQGNLDLIIIVDITNLKRNSQDLENTKNLIETLVNNTPAGIMHLDTDGKLLYINDTYLKILNLNMNDIKHFQKAFNSVFELPSLKKAGLVDDLKAVIHKGKTVERALWLETLKGETKYMHYVIAPLKSKDGRVQSVIWVGQDLTTMKQMEEERQRIDLLNSMGLFSAGIAHDFNNLLTGIIGNLSLARILIERKKYDKLINLIHQAELSAEKSRDLTYQLLNFARGGVPVKGTAQAHKIIRNLTGLIFSGSAVQIFYELHAKQDIIDINKVQFEQVLNNLLTNAYQAMNGDGNLTIKTWNEKIEPTVNPFLKEGNYFVFEIRDTGVGIDKKYLSKIFDPFFTTKSYGSGLGLATVYSIINKSNGNIFVSSKKGEGTTFKIYLPLAETLIEDEEEKTSDLQREIKSIKSARILFLDDEEYICNIVNEILTNIGQEVVTVHKGEEAIREFKKSIESKTKFDVIILDLTIKGGLGGVETFEELKKLDPGIKAILTTGYADEETIRKFKKLGFSKVLQKPFTFDQLIQVIHEHLEEG
jgi:PAS domain S-box-containing protein